MNVRHVRFRRTFARVFGVAEGGQVCVLGQGARGVVVEWDAFAVDHGAL
jgi:hypothetical protein